jgi:hypothetical protein
MAALPRLGYRAGFIRLGSSVANISPGCQHALYFEMHSFVLTYGKPLLPLPPRLARRWS